MAPRTLFIPLSWKWAEGWEHVRTASESRVDAFVLICPVWSPGWGPGLLTASPALSPLCVEALRGCDGRNPGAQLTLGHMLPPHLLLVRSGQGSPRLGGPPKCHEARWGPQGGPVEQLSWGVVQPAFQPGHEQ